LTPEEKIREYFKIKEEEKMKKLTNKQITNNLMVIHQQLAEIKSMISVFMSYINMKKDDKKLKKYIKDQNNLAKKDEKA
tara:strand:+ start:264 stop:500 length:237 start_codon:yes stop_codon:yes gene_type:complete